MAPDLFLLDGFQGHLQKGFGLGAADAREAVEEVFQAFAAFEVIDERLDGHTGAHKDGGSAKNLRVAVDYLFSFHRFHLHRL